MFGSRSRSRSRSQVPRTTEVVLDQLTKRHGRALEPGEHFVSACDCFAPDEPHPDPMMDGFRTYDEQLSVEGAAHLRLAAVRSALGMQDEDFNELPITTTGYVLAHTDRRLFVFDGEGKQYLLEAKINELWLQPIEHGDDLYTLVFKDDDERVAVATRRESVEMTRRFINSFPDRRGQARVLVIADTPSIAEF